MEPNKIENTIREKLNAREIKPSAQSWDRLDAMLSVNENKPKVKPFSYFKIISIAASVVLIVTVGLWLFNQNTSTTIIANENSIVVNDTTNNSLNTNEAMVNKNIPLLDNVKTEIVIVENTTIKNNKDNTTSDNKSETNEFKKRTTQNLLDKQVLAIKSENKIENTEKSIVKQSNSTISRESLLASIENKDVSEDNSIVLKSKSTIKINANSLLSTAESEINKEYKATNVDKIVKNFREVKSALANRNYEE